MKQDRNVFLYPTVRFMFNIEMKTSQPQHQTENYKNRVKQPISKEIRKKARVREVIERYDEKVGVKRIANVIAVIDLIVN